MRVPLPERIVCTSNRQFNCGPCTRMGSNFLATATLCLTRNIRCYTALERPHLFLFCINHSISCLIAPSILFVNLTALLRIHQFGNLLAGCLVRSTYATQRFCRKNLKELMVSEHVDIFFHKIRGIVNDLNCSFSC